MSELNTAQREYIDSWFEDQYNGRTYSAIDDVTRRDLSEFAQGLMKIDPTPDPEYYYIEYRQDGDSTGESYLSLGFDLTSKQCESMLRDKLKERPDDVLSYDCNHISFIDGQRWDIKKR